MYSIYPMKLLIFFVIEHRIRMRYFTTFSLTHSEIIIQELIRNVRVKNYPHYRSWIFINRKWGS